MIELYVGCYGETLKLNSSKSEKEILLELINSDLNIDYSTLIQDIVNSFYTKYEDLGTCEQCGSSCYNLTLEYNNKKNPYPLGLPDDLTGFSYDDRIEFFKED